jgi:hypothetical protein
LKLALDFNRLLFLPQKSIEHTAGVSGEPFPSPHLERGKVRMFMNRDESGPPQMFRPLACIPIAQMMTTSINFLKVTLAVLCGARPPQAPVKVRTWNGKQKASAMAQHTCDLIQHSVNIVDVLKNRVRKNEIELAVREREVVRSSGYNLSIYVTTTSE